MSAGGNLIFFGSVILILDVLIFSGFFPSQLNDPTLHEPWVLLPIIGALSFIGTLTLSLTIFGSLMLLSGIISIKRNK